MKVLITGATGFVGRNLAAKLLERGDTVAAFTRNKSKVPAPIRDQAEVFELDISGSGPFDGSGLRNVDVVVHAAACVDYQAKREYLFRANVGGTVNLLGLAGRAGVKRFIYISSIEATGPVSEKDAPADETHGCSPVSAYGESKLEGERQVEKFGRKLGLETTILRLGNVYGPGSLSFIRPISDAVLASNMAWLCSNWERHFWHPVYIDDAVSGIARAAGVKGSGGTYIIAGGETPTVGLLAVVIASELGKNLAAPGACGPQSLFERARAGLSGLFKPGGMRTEWAYSIGKARRELGYEPQFGLEAGIRRTLEWARKEGTFIK